MSSESALMYVALRRKRMILLFPSVELLLLTRRQSMATDRVYQRPCRHLARNKSYRETVWNTYTHERFKKNFRISKDSFNFILKWLGTPDNKKMKTQYSLNGRRPLFPDDSLDYHYTRAKMVGLGISTVREIVTQVCELIVDCIWQKCVLKHMPSIEQDLKIRWRKWMTGGSFLSVGLQLMVATFWLNAHQEEPPRIKNTIILKTVIQWCWWPW